MSTNLCDGPGCQLQASASSVVVDGPGGNLTLVAGGPAVHTGTTVAQVPTDRLGVPRPQGSAVDIGAYEWTGTAPPTEPPPIQPPSGADTTPPQVTLVSPLAGAQVSGVVTLDATATDNVAVVGLQYQLDGANLGGEQAQAPYQQAWDTSTTTPGPHTLTVSVRDAAWNYSTSAPVSVTVGAPVTPPVAGGRSRWRVSGSRTRGESWRSPVYRNRRRAADDQHCRLSNLLEPQISRLQVSV